MKNTVEKLTAEKVAEIRAKGINFDDIPEIKDFSNGHLRNWKPAKKPVSFRIDLDNLQWLQSVGIKGYQKKMNEVLRWARQNGCPLVQL